MKNLLLLFLGILLSLSAMGQCAISTPDDDTFSNTGTARFGQTFIACDDGYIGSIAIELLSGTGTYNLYLGTPTGASFPTPYQTFEVTNVGEGVKTAVAISPPFEVINGQTYEYQINRQTSNYSVGTSQNLFLDGSATVNGTPSVIGLDITSDIYIFETSNIPTLSQWGIILLSMIMALFGVVFIKNSFSIKKRLT